MQGLVPSRILKSIDVIHKACRSLECNPVVFSGLMHELGGSLDLGFNDIWSVDDTDHLAVVPRPVLALVLVLPTSDYYEQLRFDCVPAEDMHDESRNALLMRVRAATRDIWARDMPTW